ncbi:Zinc finger protein ZPR1 [Aduncisulcus paluster]|uniref:Zinc finger protein ZPR1 n=1 Tax=Aduncisulcus paluster TaxID=2918883 RepID=A0ABQ5K1K2_9EUKA|nr:Zinc finger protein ZPR1 [Aduncisulcus paluster]|eukprot:gnl/Carplike_NY0171/2353_a3171_468.p1 GENE.gnl/Carplike_NY0171/2353_a3171_468~~gnl/Carplike_NY0171/2353_a3171_468.p1  ORF type:complete len:455 (+),score=136.68 gnl/Carplike_NY0171/2353_a3171_468:39-1403(+)
MSEVQEVESLCMNCHEKGTTRLCMTMVPGFKEVLLSSFYCPHCNFSNQTIESLEDIQDKGVHYSVKISEPIDLLRHVVKGDFATITIPEIGLEMPKEAQKGSLSNVEGILGAAAEGLGQLQPVRHIQQPEVAKKIDELIAKIHDLTDLKSPFTVILDDPSGNSFVENLVLDDETVKKIPNEYKVTRYVRTKEQCLEIGVKPEQEAAFQALSAKKEKASKAQCITHDVASEEKLEEYVTTSSEVMSFYTECPSCTSRCEQRMVIANIPHFKEIVLMALKCERCGYKDVEVKSGGGISKKGKKITFNITDPVDLSRDVLKSETASVEVPMLGLTITPGSLGGFFTTIEGLLEKSKDQLKRELAFFSGDSATSEKRKKVVAFLEKFDLLMEGKTPFTIIIDDPANGSYIQNLYAPEDDPEMVEEEYKRTKEQDDELGITALLLDEEDSEEGDAEEEK